LSPSVVVPGNYLLDEERQGYVPTLGIFDDQVRLNVVERQGVTIHFG